MSSTESLSDEESLPLHNRGDNKYGYLVIDDKWHEITVGETKIGRDASICSIVLGDATISLLHAVIESEGPEDSFIYDAGSSNKTKIGKMRLKPECRYKINDNDTILMGNKIFQYKVIDHKAVESCKTKSSFNNLKSCTSDGRANKNITDKKNASEKLVLSIKEEGKKSDGLKESLFSQEKLLNKPGERYCILASELFNTDIFSQATQCEVKIGQDESVKDRNKELVESDDHIHNIETQCEYFPGSNKAESKMRFYKGSSENIKKVAESYFDDSGTFEFVRKNESKHFVSSSLCKSISDDIFDLPTQCPSKMNDSQNVLTEKYQSFRNCFFSKLFKSEKTEEGSVNNVRRELKSDSCKTKADNLNPEDVDPEFFDDDKDEELCELMKNISPRINENNDCILKPREQLTVNKRLKESNVPDEIFEVQTQLGPNWRYSKNFDESKSKSLDLELGENEKFKINQTNKKGNRLTKPGKALNDSSVGCTVMKQKVKVRTNKCISKQKLKKKVGEIVNDRGVNANDNILGFDVEDKKITNLETGKNCGGDLSTQAHSLNSDSVFQREGCITLKSVSSDDESDSDIKLRSEDSNKNGEEINSTFQNEMVNEIWEKQSNSSLVSSNKTLSDLDVREFQGIGINALESDAEENFIASQGLCLLNKSNREKLDSKIEASIRKTKSKLDIWKENWQDFIFTQKISDEKRNKSESESTDKTESDIVVTTMPIPNIEDFEINETPGEEEGVEDHSNESESLIGRKMEDDSSSSRDLCLAEEDIDEFKCESPVLLRANTQDEGEMNLMKSAEKDVNKEYEPKENGVVSDSDETDCEEELKTRKLSFIHPFNQKGEEVPSTSNLKSKDKCGEGKGIVNENIFFEKRECSPLKRARRSDVDTVLLKKRPKNIRKKKESDDIEGRQLRSRGAKACTERFESENCRGNNKVKESSGKKLVNTDVGSRKKFDFVNEKSLKKSDRTRSGCSESKWKPSSVKIVFTGFESESHNRIISKLGGLRVNDFDEGNVLVTDKVRRTVKFLSAVALGLPIVSPKWLLSSSKELRFLNPWNFLLEDEASEDRWGFSLKNSLESWRKEKLLEGFNVFATRSTKPPVPEILNIVKCCGGTAFTSYPEVWPEKSIVLTCLEDKKSWPHYKYRNVKILHYEFLLSGVLKHLMDFKTYKLR